MGVIASCLAFNLAECVCCMGCSCLSFGINCTLSQASRFGHLLVIIVTFILAIVLGRSYPDKVDQYNLYTKISLSSGCAATDVNECIYRQLIYRASFSLVCLFSLLAILSYCTEYVNKSFWIIKFGLAIGVFIGFWWVDNSVFDGWAEVARVLSFFWLLVQGLLFLDFAHDSHDMLMAAADDDITTRGSAREVYSVYIILSVGFLTCSGVGLGYLFRDYAGCQLAQFYTILTLLMGVLLTAISLLNTVNKGLLTPCLIFAYSVFLCWYALLSSPNPSCNPNAYSNWSKPQETAVIIVAIISMLVLGYCIGNGTKILNVFNPAGEGVIQSYQGASAEMKAVLTGEDEAGTKRTPAASNQSTAVNAAAAGDGEGGVTTTEPGPGTSSRSAEQNRTVVPESSGTPHERVFFHILMVLFCSYAAMIATDWGNSNGSPIGLEPLRGTESMWLKICSQWVFLLLYCKVLHAAYVSARD